MSTIKSHRGHIRIFSCYFKIFNLSQNLSQFHPIKNPKKPDVTNAGIKGKSIPDKNPTDPHTNINNTILKNFFIIRNLKLLTLYIHIGKKCFREATV